MSEREDTHQSGRDSGDRPHPASDEQAESPEPGYPVGDTKPLGGEVPSKEHPEDIGSTPSDEEGSEDVTETPGAPADPDSGQ